MRGERRSLLRRRIAPQAWFSWLMYARKFRLPMLSQNRTEAWVTTRRVRSWNDCYSVIGSCQYFSFFSPEEIEALILRQPRPAGLQER